MKYSEQDKADIKLLIIKEKIEQIKIDLICTIQSLDIYPSQTMTQQECSKLLREINGRVNALTRNYKLQSTLNTWSLK